MTGPGREGTIERENTGDNFAATNSFFCGAKRSFWMGFIVLSCMVSWFLFADVADIGLSSHDADNFSNNRAISEDFTFFFSSDKIHPTGRPTAELIKWLIHVGFGDNPVAFHWSVIGLHTLASMLLPVLLCRLGASVELSAIAALLFLVNTAHYEAVHHIAALDYPLALVCGLMALYGYFRYFDALKLRWLWLFYVGLILAITAHTAIGVLLLFGLYWNWTKGALGTALYRLAPMVLVSVLLVFAHLLTSAADTNVLSSLESQSTMSAQVLIIGFVRVGLWLLGRLFTTAHWLPFRVYEMHAWELWAGVFALVALLVIAAKNRELGRIGVIWIVLMLLPFALLSEQTVITILPAGPPRYMYFASVGSSLLLAWSCLQLGRLLSSYGRYVTIGLVLTLGASSYSVQGKTEALSLYIASQSYNDEKGKPECIQQLGWAIDRGGDAIDAHTAYMRICLLTMGIGESCEALLAEGLQRFPDSVELRAYRLANASMHGGQPPELSTQMDGAPLPQSILAVAYHNLGLGFIVKGDLPSAIIASRTELSLQPQREKTRRQYAAALSNLGIELAARGQWQEAEQSYAEAIALEPNRAENYRNLGSLLLEQGDRKRAVSAFLKAIELGAVDPAIYWALAQIYRDNDELEQAAQIYILLLEGSSGFLGAGEPRLDFVPLWALRRSNLAIRTGIARSRNQCCPV
ncbi:MAG: tetratricopeptide repeat protein [Candidatus Latescibacterota bacterium]